MSKPETLSPCFVTHTHTTASKPTRNLSRIHRPMRAKQRQELESEVTRPAFASKTCFWQSWSSVLQTLGALPVSHGSARHSQALTASNERIPLPHSALSRCEQLRQDEKFLGNFGVMQ